MGCAVEKAQFLKETEEGRKLRNRIERESVQGRRGTLQRQIVSWLWSIIRSGGGGEVENNPLNLGVERLLEALRVLSV